MLLTTLLEPFQFSFMVNAMLVATIVAIPCALLSVFLVLKGWALMGDAMSHAVFPGVVVAYIAGIPFDAPRDKCGHSGAINHGHTCCYM